jgi:hypothetical protein
VNAPGLVQVNVANLASSLGVSGKVFLRLFAANGTQIGTSATNSLTFANASTSLTNYYIGVSSAGNVNYNPTTGVAGSGGTGYGSYQLNIATNIALVTPADSTSFATAANLGVLGSSGFTINAAIAPLGNLAYPALPGGPQTPGNRNLGSQDVPGESNEGANNGSSIPGTIPVFQYNFQDVYGVDPFGNILHNAITEQQKTDARQIFSMYGKYLGIEFVETASSGLTVVTGDVRAVAPGISPNGVGGISGGGEVIMNANIDFGASEYGGTWFGIAFHEIGHAIGLSHSYDAPGVMGGGVGNNGGESPPIPGQPSIGSVESVYPGDINLVPAENINPADSTDINLYSFTLATAGTFSAETLAQRLTLVATATSDFSTQDGVEVSFTAKQPGSAGAGISLTFHYVDLGAGSSVPQIAVDGTQISVTLNTDPAAQTTANGLVTALNTNKLASTLITASVSGGVNATPGTTPIGLSTSLDFRLQLAAAADPSTLDTVLSLYSTASAQATGSSPFATASLPLAQQAAINFTALPQGTAGNGISIVFTKADLGKNIGPSISVNGTTIAVVLNTDLVGFTTANILATAINSDVLAQNLVTAVASGAGKATTNLGTNFSGSTVTLAGGSGSRTLISRNDNYFGTDSLINMHLAAGTYYVAVSSVGNTKFDPSVLDSGFGGNTDGKYQLKLSFTADPAAGTTFADAGINGSGGGVALAGNGVNSTGTAFNYWFKTSTGDISQAGGNTVFVDKLNTGDPAQIGSLTHPYSDIADALNAAIPGTIVRIVGNGGADGNVATTADNLSYQIGFDSQGNVAADGSTFVVPQGVDVMIDAGAIIKLNDAVINVGDTVPGIDRSNGALQLLGTPGNNVILTSLFDNTVGGTADPLQQGGPSQGDWGGIIYNQSSDFQGTDTQGKGVFLDSVNQATFTYGGGKVTVDSVQEIVDPIFISNPMGTAQFFARPTIWFNTITLSADSAMSADPNSLANTEDRIGPNLFSNEIFNNSINAFFIRVQTAPGQPIEQLDLAGRITHTDIVYVLAENLHLTGSPGGLYEPDPSDPTHAGWSDNMTGSLVIDPGVILKMSGSTIQMEVGHSQLIAEGTVGNPIIMTSINDSAYGAAGTFLTSNNPAAVPVAGDWGGIFFNSNSSGSIDHAVIDYAGGSVGIPGGFAHFNPIEIQQANVRIANTLFSYNASGDSSGDADPNRAGLLSNDGATIFVRGAQPVLVGNSFFDDDGYVASVNANALNNIQVNDWGDSVGALNAISVNYTNYGPLVANDTYGFDSLVSDMISGMEVRSEEITTQTIWDDTGIVHVVTGAINDVINQHTFGGIRIESNATASLVVKLQGAGAGFFINGIGLDIIGRIGGALQLVGNSAHPVILTSLKDDTVGAGFRLDGLPQNDTNGDGSFSAPAPGDWNSVTLMPYSNDANVAVINQTNNSNTTPATAQFMGQLAPDLSGNTSATPQGGNDYLPLGFDIHGALNQPTTTNVYSFNATVGTEVWFQIGQSSPSLASVLELVDSTGKVLATSDPSKATPSNPYGISAAPGVVALTILKDPTLGGVFYSENPRDAMMRVVLPGAVGTTNTYFIRVRSDGGKTAGAYELQVRLQQSWVTPGSTVQYSDISYATDGIQIEGLPANSVIAGTQTSTGTNTSFGGAQNLGNLLATNDSTLDVGGNLASSLQTDWYKFNLQYDLIQAIAGVNAGGKTLGTVFQVFYADGLARANTTLSVFDATGTLILISRDGGVTSVQPGPLEGNGLTDLTRGSVGALDPFIGSAQLPADTPSGTGFTYYVAITSNAQVPNAVDAYFGTAPAKPGGILTPNGASNLTRLEPIDSVQRIVEDHIGFTGYTTGDPALSTSIQPTTGPILPIDSTSSVSQNVVPFTLSDVTLFTLSGNTLSSADAWSGTDNYDIRTNMPGLGTGSIKMRSDGTLWEYYTTSNAANQIGTISQIDPGTGAVLTTLGADNIPNLPASGTPTIEEVNGGQVDSFVWGPYLPGTDGITGSKYNLYYADHGFGALGFDQNSRLIRANPVSGLGAFTNGTPWGFEGFIKGTSGVLNSSFYTMGMEYVGNTLYGVNDNGQFYTINAFSGKATLIKDFNASDGITGFTGLTLGPQNLLNVNGTNLAGGGPSFQNILFATTDTGEVLAFDTAGNLQQAFFNGNATDPTTFGTQSNGTLFGVNGIAFSPLDFNLWHPTTLMNPQAGHGVLAAPDNSRNTIFLNSVGSSVDSRNSSERAGGASYYFGLENWVQTPNPGNDYIQYTDSNGNFVNGQYGVQANTNLSGQGFQQVLTSNDAQSGLGNNYNLPGGAHGSLVTNPFSLATYSALDEPTLYYNYILQTAGVNSLAVMQDSARVYASTDGGFTWQELTTNNLVLSAIGGGAELPTYITPRALGNPSDPLSLATVQPTFNTNQWQQARVDLSELAGAPSIQLKFDFSTAGTMFTDFGFGNQSTGNPGEFTGVGPTDKRTGQNNNFLGFGIDDIIVGFANRGEMVTGAAIDTSFAGMPVNPDPAAPKQALTGSYNLEIRQGQNYGTLTSGISPDIALTGQFDDNQRLITGTTLLAPDASSISNGDTFTISDGTKQVIFVFDPAGTALPSNEQLVPFTAGDDAPTVARSIRDAINAAAQAKKFTVTAEISDGLITGSTSPFGLTDTDPGVDLILAQSVTPGANFGSNNPSFVNSYQLLGDQMTARPQGHIQILNNTISFAKQYGIAVLPAPRDNGGTSHPNSVLNLPTLDTNRQVPGPNIVSNVIDNSGVVGIEFAGDNSAGSVGAVPYGRIVNNTIYGGATPAGFGIAVQNNAAPTILNNIIANTATGIFVDGTSGSTVVGTEVFSGNTTNGVTGTNPVFLAPSAPLFVNPGLASNTSASGAGFYLKEGSLAIDASLNSLGDRATMVTVLSPLGLPQSPIIAPANDRFGQLRVDDPAVPNATGLGSNIFIDRGAIERADFVGPTAKLTNPLDGGSDDGDPTTNNVFIILPTALTEFDLQLNDVGVGIDNSTVKSSDFVVTQTDPLTNITTTLKDGTDYKFVYNTTTHTVQFESFTTFSTSLNYKITIPTVGGVLPIADLAGNPIQANQSNGTVVFNIVGNHAPVLNSFTTFSAFENIPTPPVTYAQLLAAAQPANMSIVANHTADFLITSIPNGSLTITKFVGGATLAVVPNTSVNANKSNLIEPGDTVTWNSGTNLGPSITAFTVIGYDATNASIAPALAQSSPPVPVNFSVINPTPIVANASTTVGGPVGTPTNPIQFPISFNTLVTGLGIQWFEATGANQELKITTKAHATFGTLYFNGVAQADNTTFIMKSTDTLAWVAPPNLQNPPFNIPLGSLGTITGAFTVQAFDNFIFTNPTIFTGGYNVTYATSTTSGSVNMLVLNVPPPTFTPPGLSSVTILNQPQNVATPITFAQLQTLTGAAIGFPGDELAFRLESLPASPQGTLFINGVAITPAMVATGTVFIRGSSAGHPIADTVVWVGPTGLLPGAAPVTDPAFTVSAFDFTRSLDGFQNCLININLKNFAPTLTTVLGSNLGSASQQTQFNITYQALLNQSNATDLNADVISFLITSVPANGTLTITKTSVAGSPTFTVVPGVTPGVNNTNLIQPGDVVHWTPKLGVSGSAVTAFSVAAWDGAVSSITVSSPPVPVNINVLPLGSAFDLSGTWLVVAPSGLAVGIGRIAQNGPNLPTILNYNGVGTTGVYATFNTIKAVSLDGVANMIGTVDTTTADFGRISWTDGATWLKISLGGSWAATSGGTTNLGTVTQSNNVITVSGVGSSYNATIGFNSTTGQLQLQLPNGTATPLINDSFSAFGVTWKKLDLPPNYTSSFGGTASVVQNGSPMLQLINSQGQSSPGMWSSPTTIVATTFGITGTVGNGTITWSNGDVWTESVTLTGKKNGVAGTTSIAASAPTAVLSTPPSVTGYANSTNTSLSEFVVRKGANTVLFFNDQGTQALGTLTNNGSQATIAAWGVTATFGTNKITFSGPVPGAVPTAQWNLTPQAVSPFTITSYVNSTTAQSDFVIVNNQNTAATFINEAGTFVTGTVLGSTATAAGLGLGLGTLSAGKITWASGAIWVQTTTQLGVVTPNFFYNAANSKSEQMIANGNYRLFINDAGTAAFGTLNAAGTQATIAAFGQIATFGATGNITFAAIATPNVVAATWVKTSALLPLITMTDTTGAVFHVRITSSTTMVVVDGTALLPAGTIGTRQSKLISWSNSSASWNTFDFNALNALFQMSAGYP